MHGNLYDEFRLINVRKIYKLMTTNKVYLYFLK